jgi:hypothetical protein
MFAVLYFIFFVIRPHAIENLKCLERVKDPELKLAES